MVEESKVCDEPEEKSKRSSMTAWGLIFGSGIGIVFGPMFGDLGIALGIPFGAAFGLIVGAWYDSSSIKERDH